MTNSLDLEHLRTIVAIAECGGFGKAAAARHISQPALSQHVRLLERALKRKLFEKDGRMMRFTAAGEQVLAEARKILDVHDESLRMLEVGRTETVTVGCGEHAAEQELPVLLEAFVNAFPGRSTRFEIGRSARLADGVLKGAIDVAFVLDTTGQGAGHEVGRLPLLWYAAPDWRPPVGDLPMPLVAFEEPCRLREIAVHQLAAAGHGVEVVATSGSLEGVLAGVRAGLGVALLPGTGDRMPGLTVRDDLPEAREVLLRLISRQGVPPEIEQAAVDAGVAFYATRPRLQVVGETARTSY
jgi:DNA-binding transcriptional LysR family regulator